MRPTKGFEEGGGELEKIERNDKPKNRKMRRRGRVEEKVTEKEEGKTRRYIFLGGK